MSSIQEISALKANAKNKTLITNEITNEMLQERKVIILPNSLMSKVECQKVLLEIFQKSHILGITWNEQIIKTPILQSIQNSYFGETCIMLKKTNE